MWMGGTPKTGTALTTIGIGCCGGNGAGICGGNGACDGERPAASGCSTAAPSAASSATLNLCSAGVSSSFTLNFFSSTIAMAAGHMSAFEMPFVSNDFFLP